MTIDNLLQQKPFETAKELQDYMTRYDMFYYISQNFWEMEQIREIRRWYI